MRLRRYSWFYILLVIFAHSAYSATPYYTKFRSPSQGGVQYATAREACIAEYRSTNAAFSYSTSARDNGDGTWQCIHGCISGWCDTQWKVYQHTPITQPDGSLCGSTPGGGDLIKDDEGNCVDPKLADKGSYCKYLSGTTRNRRASVQFNEDGTVIPPSVSGADGCEGSVVSWDNCKMPAPRKACSETTGNCVSMQSLQASCMVLMNFTGEVSDEGVPHGGYEGSKGEDGLCGPGEPCDFPDLPNVNEQQPCNYVTDAEGRKSCSSFNYNGKPGNGMGCGTFNGQFGCYGTASSEGSQIDTKITQTPTPDGGIKEEKTDTYQKTVCSGPGSCSTTITTNKSTTIKNGNGETVSESSECTGPHCAEGGKGGKGDSNGDGIKDADDEGEEGTEVGGQDWYQEGEKTYGDVIGGFSERVSDLPAVQGVSNFLTFTPSGACPVYQTSAWVWDIRLDHWCRDTIPWPLIGGVVMGLFATLAFRIAFL